MGRDRPVTPLTQNGPNRLATGSKRACKSPFFHTERGNIPSFWAGINFSPLIVTYTHICVCWCVCPWRWHISWSRRQLNTEISIFAHQKAPSNIFPSHCFHSPAAFRPRSPTTRHWKAFQQNVYERKKKLAGRHGFLCNAHELKSMKISVPL